MLIDVTIDTNVFMHAEDSRQQLQKDAIAIIDLFQNSDTFLCIDEGFDLTPSQNKSHIGAEYITHLRSGTRGYTFLLAKIAADRISEVPRMVRDEVGRYIRNTLRKDPSDRIYLLVAYQSKSKILFSHNDKHFTFIIKREAYKKTGVKIVKANEEYE